MLLYKGGGKPLSKPGSFRLISLIDSTVKLFERLVLSRLEESLTRNGGISTRQFGFRKGSGTVEAIRKVVNFDEVARRTRPTETQTSLMVTLDVQNAFNTASWTSIDRALCRKGINGHLTRVLCSYMSQKKLVIPTDQGIQLLMVGAGVPEFNSRTHPMEYPV